ncbi:MAG: hypothetical protein SVK54_05620 [candidate division WOR-3 bacterium]|nr:hypothetical protein [candidate division WOR-3 bacterium]
MKKFVRLFVFAIAISMLVFAVGCNNADDTEGVAPDEAVETMDTENEMTEEIYIDIVAHTMYWTSEELTEDQSGKKLEMLYNEHGVTEEQFSDYEAMLLENPQEYNKIMEKVDKRVEELSNEEAPKEEVKDKKETK